MWEPAKNVPDAIIEKSLNEALWWRLQAKLQLQELAKRCTLL